MSLEKENKRLREQLEEANKLAATLALLLDEAYNELGVDSGKEVGKPKFEAFYVECTKEEYPEVKAILNAKGHLCYDDDWSHGEDCISVEDGEYFAFWMRKRNPFRETFNLFQLRQKYGLTT